MDRRLLPRSESDKFSIYLHSYKINICVTKFWKLGGRYDGSGIGWPKIDFSLRLERKFIRKSMHSSSTYRNQSSQRNTSKGLQSKVRLWNKLCFDLINLPRHLNLLYHFKIEAALWHLGIVGGPGKLVGGQSKSLWESPRDPWNLWWCFVSLWNSTVGQLWLQASRILASSPFIIDLWSPYEENFTDYLQKIWVIPQQA